MNKGVPYWHIIRFPNPNPNPKPTHGFVDLRRISTVYKKRNPYTTTTSENLITPLLIYVWSEFNICACVGFHWN